MWRTAAVTKLGYFTFQSRSHGLPEGSLSCAFEKYFLWRALQGVSEKAPLFSENCTISMFPVETYQLSPTLVMGRVFR